MTSRTGKIKIAVTGLNATDNPGPGVPVIRCLREGMGEDVELIGLVYDTLEPGIFIPGLVEKCYQIPYPSTGLDAVAARILQIHERENIDVLFCTLDTELYSFGRLASTLREKGIATYLPNSDQLKMRGKDQLAAFCYEIHARTPRTHVINSQRELESEAEKLGYPCVVKGIFYDASIVSSKDEARTAMNKLAAKWGMPLILQEYLKGDEYNVCALGDGTGGVVGAVAMRKLYITEKGKGWSGVTIYDEALLELSRTVIKALKWKGGMELEFTRIPGSSEYYLLEINPRFPAWVYLPHVAGQNLPLAMVKLARGEHVEYFTKYEAGKLFVRAAWDYATDMKAIEKLSMTGEL
jgi:carbamoyl-phosphate synthase large subunit